MKNFKFLLLVAALFVASTGMAKDLWTVNFATKPVGKLGDHAKVIKAVLKENLKKGFSKLEVNEGSKTLVITFDHDRVSPEEIVNLLNEQMPTLNVTMSESIQKTPVEYEKALEKFEDAKKARQKAVDKLKDACSDYDKAYKNLEDQINKASKRGFVQQNEIVRTTIKISED